MIYQDFLQEQNFSYKKVKDLHGLDELQLLRELASQQRILSYYLSEIRFWSQRHQRLPASGNLAPIRILNQKS